MDFVPFNRAYLTGAELGYMADAIATTRLSGNGPYSDRCARWLEHRTGTARALMTHSCSGALEMATALADIGAGDEVVMPSFTFVSCANAVVARGGVPVFVDVRSDTLNLDEALVDAAVTKRTKAVMAVHYAGVGCEMDVLTEIASERGLMVIEDAAQGILATYKGRPLGTIGDVGALSFHETKNVMCGEGGALFVNRAKWAERAEIVHEKGTDRRRFFRGQVDKYTWQEIGSSYPLSDLAAAFLWAQLEHADEITRRRIQIWDAYHEGLEELEEAGALRRPVVPDHCVHNAHLYYVLLSHELERDAFINALEDAGINAVFHYVPLHSSPAGRRFGRSAGDLSVTTDVSERLVRLPLWAGMEPATIGRVIEAVRHCLRTEPSRSRP